jgi:hypothetical protein
MDNFAFDAAGYDLVIATTAISVILAVSSGYMCCIAYLINNRS